MHYEKGIGYVEASGAKVCSKREMALRLARCYGHDNDTASFTRLRIESRVAYPLLVEAWRSGVAFREAGIDQ